MKTLSLILVICSLSIFSCGQKTDPPQSTGNATSGGSKPPQSPIAGQTSKEKPAAENQEAEGTVSSNNSNDIRVNFPTGATQVTMNGTINGIGQNITYVFEVSNGQKLTASVKPKSSKGNIRIAQIISPSGNANGPFGDQMTYALNESGDWKLVINESQMLGESWKGEYFLTIEIK